MNKLNNKGYMLVEIVLASAIAFAIAYFIIDLTVKLKNKNDDVYVEMLATTDNSIITNKLMNYAVTENEDFQCSKISKSGNTIKYDGKIIDVVNEYTQIGNISCSLSTDEQDINIRIPLTVKQQSDKNFDVVISYKYVVPADVFACEGFHNPPVLTSGLIPINISDEYGTVTAVGVNDKSWYSYCNQKWANAVLVKSNGVKTRAQNSVPGTVIAESDILAYFVWIPRYSYKLFYVGYGDQGGKQRTIEIKYVEPSVNETGTRVGEWLTHPAFNFGNERLSGFWMGKFETTGSNDFPTIKPHGSSITVSNMNDQFKTALKFAGGYVNGGGVGFSGNGTYGLPSTSDTHIVKNSEWGAVAYLAHSVEGINKQVRKNSNGSTGCGASYSSPNGTQDTCYDPYGKSRGTPAYQNTTGDTVTYPQSTNGNITGVFDMVGGANEYVMGRYKYPADNQGWVDDSIINSGNKYCKLYTNCGNNACLGDALSETRGWYSNYSSDVDPDYAWYLRGGGGWWNGGSAVGLFSYNAYDGRTVYGSFIYGTFRVALVTRN